MVVELPSDGTRSSDRRARDGCGSFATASDENELIVVFKFRRGAVPKDLHPLEILALVGAGELDRPCFEVLAWSALIAG